MSVYYAALRLRLFLNYLESSLGPSVLCIIEILGCFYWMILREKHHTAYRTRYSGSNASIKRIVENYVLDVEGMR